MDEINDRIRELIFKDLQGNLTPEETLELQEWKTKSNLSDYWQKLGATQDNTDDTAFLEHNTPQTDQQRIQTILQSDTDSRKRTMQSRRFQSVIETLKSLLRNDR